MAEAYPNQETDDGMEVLYKPVTITRFQPKVEDLLTWRCILRYSGLTPRWTRTSFQELYGDGEPEERILDCLNRIKWEQDGTLSYRMSCGHGVCGSDGMKINGRAPWPARS